jgi:hypothetical protein
LEFDTTIVDSPDSDDEDENNQDNQSAGYKDEDFDVGKGVNA